MKTIGTSVEEQQIRKQPISGKSGFAKAALLAAGIALSSCHSSNISQQPPRPADANSISQRASSQDAVPASPPIETVSSLCEAGDLVATRNDSSKMVKQNVCYEGTVCAILEERISTTTVSAGSRLPFQPWSVRIIGIDGTGVDLAFDEGRQPLDPIRLNYGRVWRLGEFVLVQSIRAEPGPDSTSARVVLCQPIFPDDR